MSHKLSVGATSQKNKFTLVIMVLCDVTPNTLTDRYIQCHENITSYQFEVYGLTERDAMYKGDPYIHHSTYLNSPEVDFHIGHSMQ
jgi:hypothetical protein